MSFRFSNVAGFYLGFIVDLCSCCELNSVTVFIPSSLSALRYLYFVVTCGGLHFFDHSWSSFFDYFQPIIFLDTLAEYFVRVAAATLETYDNILEISFKFYTN